MGSRYSQAFIEQALIKVYSRGDRTVQSVAEELNVYSLPDDKSESPICIYLIVS
jgi:hypothetical protein